MNLILLIICLLLVIGLILVIVQYTKLARFKNKVEKNWSGVEVQLKRRYELLPELMEIVKPFTKNEKSVFEKITTTHKQALSAGNVMDQAFAENKLSQSLKSLFALSEDYPKLKISEDFRNVQQELSDVEDAIQLAQRNYNTTVQENNVKLEKFLGILMARPLGFGKFDFFEMG